MKKSPLGVAGVRHVLRSLLSALHYMHGLGVVHADLKPAIFLLKGAGAFEDGWRKLFGGKGSDCISRISPSETPDSETPLHLTS